jgi:hypothetical protein
MVKLFWLLVESVVFKPEVVHHILDKIMRHKGQSKGPTYGQQHIVV